jgi:cyclophilin family peptidyl-prolyl cis-trans isomerase
VRYLRCLSLLCLALLPGCSTGPTGPNPVVVMDTTMGPVKIELFQDKAPVTVKNFLAYVDDKHYDGTIFHRVISNFMIQGGNFEPGMRPKNTGPQIRNEAGNGLKNTRGTIAMARTNEPDSATDQFFINVVDNSSKLDRAGRNAGYAVFGKVIDGMDVVDKIKDVPTGTVGVFASKMDDVPLQDVGIRSIRRVEAKEKEQK